MPAEESLHTQFQNLISSEQWDRARDVLYELLAMQPESTWLHQQMGSVLHELKNLKDAEIHLKTAIAHDPSYAEAFTELASVYLSMGRLGTADDTVKVALSLDPYDPHSWMLSFQIALAYDDIPQAKHCYSQLERIIPESAALTDLRTKLLSHPKNKDKIDYEAQLLAHEKTLAQDPEYDMAHYSLAELHLKHTKKYDLAEKHIRTALQKDPGDTDYQKILMRVVRKKNLWLRLLSSPAELFTSIEEKDKEDFVGIIVIVVFLAAVALLSNNNPYLLRFLIFGLITFFMCSYTISKLYEYMTLTEVYHEMGKVARFKGPFRKIHRLPYQYRFVIFVILTLISWVVLALAIYLLIE